MRIIYADSLFILNFAADYLLLLATGKLCSLPLRPRRMVTAAAWGGLYALLSALEPELFGSGPARLTAGLICAAAAFWGLGPFPRTALCFLAVAAAFGGAVYALPTPALSLKTLLLAFALCYAALSLVFRGAGAKSRREIREAHLCIRGRSCTLRALRDTGNELRDSRGAPVFAAEWSALSGLFPELEKAEPGDPAALFLAISALPGMGGRCRMLSCLTAAGGGLLVTVRHDSLSIDGAPAPHRHTAIIACPLSPDGGYQAVF